MPAANTEQTRLAAFAAKPWLRPLPDVPADARRLENRQENSFRTVLENRIGNGFPFGRLLTQGDRRPLFLHLQSLRLAVADATSAGAFADARREIFRQACF